MWCFYGNVIEQRQRRSPNAEYVVDVHRDTIDADRIVAVHHLRDDRLGTDPVGADRQADPADVDDIGEIADIQLQGADSAGGRPSLFDARDDFLEGGLRRVCVDPGRFLELIPGFHNDVPVALLLCAMRD